MKPDNSRPPIKFISGKGSLLTGKHKSKEERILETMYDLHLVIEGCEGLSDNFGKANTFQHLNGAIAHACSIFLRKMVLGDRGNAKTRLLDDEITKSLGLTFDRLKKVPKEREDLNFSSQKMDGGNMFLTKIDENTGLPEATWNIPIEQMTVDLFTDWPLPGMANWTQSKRGAWKIRPEELFDTNATNFLDCNEWLGQQLIIFDNKGVTLKDVIRTIANYEGAHAINVSRLSKPESETKNYQPANNPGLHILNNIKVCGLKYTHIIVIESALYLYGKLIKNELCKSLKDEIPKLEISYSLSSSEDIFLNCDKWLSYDGGFLMSFGGKKRTISHRIKTVG